MKNEQVSQLLPLDRVEYYQEVCVCVSFEFSFLPVVFVTEKVTQFIHINMRGQAMTAGYLCGAIGHLVFMNRIGQWSLDPNISRLFSSATKIGYEVCF